MAAGEQAGILETLLDRLATYKEKILAIKSKIKAALFYPIAIIAVAFIITAVIMIFVIPAFKQVFTSFGADLPGADAVRDGDLGLRSSPTGTSSSPSIGGGIYGFLEAWKRSLRGADLHGQAACSRLPVFGDLVRNLDHRALDAHAARPCSPPACRWSRRSTRWAAPRATTSTWWPPSRSSTR